LTDGIYKSNFNDCCAKNKEKPELENQSGLLREYAPVNLDKERVDDLVISCSDHRFREAFRAVPQNRGVKYADEITFPGPSIEVANGVLIPKIALLEKKHGFSTVHIEDHTHCGGFEAEFGEDYAALEDEDAMAEIHEKKLAAAVAALHLALPKLTVVTYVVGVEEVISTKSYSHVRAG
jgi:hypothetical protein